MRIPAWLLMVIVLAAPALLAQNSDAGSLDGLLILRKMGERYAAAKFWYIAATEEETSTSDYSRSWTKTEMVSAVSANKYHYEGHSQTGSAFHISDGHTAWDFHPEEHAYTQKMAPVSGYRKMKAVEMNEMAAQRGVDLRSELAKLYTHYGAATRLPDATIYLGGIAVRCYIVRISAEQRKGPTTAGLSLEETLWIDQATWAVRQTLTHENSFIYAGSAHIPIVIDRVTTYATAELDSAVPEVLFHFEPPADAHVVTKFNEGIMGTDLTGETAPEVWLVGVNEKRVPLSS